MGFVCNLPGALEAGLVVEQPLDGHPLTGDDTEAARGAGVNARWHDAQAAVPPVHTAQAARVRWLCGHVNEPRTLQVTNRAEIMYLDNA